MQAVVSRDDHAHFRPRRLARSMSLVAALPPSMLAPAQSAEISPRRFKIYFQDDAVRQRSQETAQQLLASAASTDSTSTSALLAKKALKYRKVFDRMSGVDVTAPTFDASKFLGVDWCKTPSLKAHCARAQ